MVLDKTVLEINKQITDSMEKYIDARIDIMKLIIPISTGYLSAIFVFLNDKSSFILHSPRCFFLSIVSVFLYIFLALFYIFSIKKYDNAISSNRGWIEYDLRYALDHKKATEQEILLRNICLTAPEGVISEKDTVQTYLQNKPFTLTKGNYMYLYDKLNEGYIFFSEKLFAIRKKKMIITEKGLFVLTNIFLLSGMVFSIVSIYRGLFLK